MSRIHGGGSPLIDFNHVASPGVGTRVEPKVCEQCGRQFFRPVALDAWEGLRYCGACQRVLKEVQAPARGRPRLLH